MPIHESPPPSIRGFGPTPPSGASTPRPRPVTPRGSQEDLSGSCGRSAFHGLHDGPQKHVRIEEPKERGTAWYAGFGLGRILRHRWFAWIAPKLKWKLLQPVIRCSIAVSPSDRPELTQGMDRMDHSAYSSKSTSSGTSSL
jgi:hypothetical protein